MKLCFARVVSYWKLGLILSSLLTFGVIACRITGKSASDPESVTSLHVTGKIVLWWSPDGTRFFVKECSRPVPHQPITSLEEMERACPGSARRFEITRADLLAKMEEIATSSSGLMPILGDASMRRFLEELRAGAARFDLAKIELENLKSHLEQVAEDLERTVAEIVAMEAVASQAAAAEGRAVLSSDLKAIFGDAVKAAHTAIQVLRRDNETSSSQLRAKAAAFDEAERSFEFARNLLLAQINRILDHIADQSQVHVVSTLQAQDFAFKLLENAGRALGFFAFDMAYQNASCDQLCVMGSPIYSVTRCYSCRCKAAMGGFMPTPEELNCAVAKEIKIYKSQKVGDEFLLEEQQDTAEGEGCFNPALLGGDCKVGSRFGQLTRGDVSYKWICRRKKNLGNPEGTYDDVGVIASNAATGASCWWNDTADTISDTRFPKLDLSRATPEEIAYNQSTFGHTSGESCMGCHDNDPFMYSPYLRSIEWQTGPYTRSLYSTVQLDGTLLPAANYYLKSESVNACTSCHRIGGGSTCGSWAAESMGTYKGSGYEKNVLNAMDVGIGGAKRSGTDWQLAYWMPPPRAGDFHTGTFGDWHNRYGEAKDKIAKCCANKNSAGCKWVDINGRSVNP